MSKRVKRETGQKFYRREIAGCFATRPRDCLGFEPDGNGGCRYAAAYVFNGLGVISCGSELRTSEE